MLGDNRQYVSIDECINSYLDRSEGSIHRYFKCWHIAFDGLREMGLDFFFQIKSVKLPVNSNLTVNLPDDYLNYSKVGVFNANSEVIPLKYNDKLTTYADLQPNRQQMTEDNNIYNLLTFNSLIWYNFWNGESFTNLYGIPSGAPFVGGFKIDTAAGVIVLDPGFIYSYIALEYIASPVEKGTYYLPMQFKAALIAYIGWQDVMYLPVTRKGTLGDKEQRKRNFYNERRLAWARYRPIHLEEAYEWNLENQRLVVKG